MFPSNVAIVHLVPKPQALPSAGGNDGNKLCLIQSMRMLPKNLLGRPKRQGEPANLSGREIKKIFLPRSKVRQIAAR